MPRSPPEKNLHRPSGCELPATSFFFGRRFPMFSLKTPHFRQFLAARMLGRISPTDSLIIGPQPDRLRENAEKASRKALYE
jgi:hypothetical protein